MTTASSWSARRTRTAPSGRTIDLRAVPTAESIVLALDGPGVAPAADPPPMAGRLVAVHELEPVSVSVLVKSGIVSETTFHRSKLALIREGIVVREGTGNATRYRLTGEPDCR
jgi:hypothetical protein